MKSFSEIKLNGVLYYKPQPKQTVFHNFVLNRAENGYRDFLYGGSSKGGKSHALRWEAHRNCLHYPEIRGLLIRSSFPELERTHLSRLQNDLPSEVASYNQQKHTYTYFNNSILEFGYGERKSDFDQFLSAEYDFIIIDELTTIPFEFSYLLRSRLASSRSDFIPFWACASNPGGKAHNDVKKYFISKSGLDRELFPLYKPEQVCFVPATVYDNQILLNRDPAVLTRLQQLSKKDQQKYLYGNWDIFEGQFFDEYFEDVHIIKAGDYLSYEDIKKFKLGAGLDYGNTTVCEFMYMDYNGNVVVFDEWYDKNSTRSEKVNQLKEFVQIRGLTGFDIVADTNLWLPDQFDVDNSNYPAMDFMDAGLRLIKVSKNQVSPEKHRGYRVACNDGVRNYLHWQEKDGILTIKPKLKIYERCKYLKETLSTLVTAKNDVEDIEDKQDDHAYDAFKMMFMTLYKPKEKIEDTRPEWRKKLDRQRQMQKKSIMAA